MKTKDSIFIVCFCFLCFAVGYVGGSIRALNIINTNYTCEEK